MPNINVDRQSTSIFGEASVPVTDDLNFQVAVRREDVRIVTADGALVQLITSDSTGAYELLNLTLGHYVVVETDPETTEVVVMTATVLPKGSEDARPTISEADRQLLTAVVNLAEHAGKPVKPLIVPTDPESTYNAFAAFMLGVPSATNTPEGLPLTDVRQNRTGFYFNVPTRYRKLGCSIPNEPLGSDYIVACGEDANGVGGGENQRGLERRTRLEQ